jgi:hypothetical protein
VRTGLVPLVRWKCHRTRRGEIRVNDGRRIHSSALTRARDEKRSIWGCTRSEDTAGRGGAGQIFQLAVGVTLHQHGAKLADDEPSLSFGKANKREGSGSTNKQARVGERGRSQETMQGEKKTKTISMPAIPVLCKPHARPARTSFPTSSPAKQVKPNLLQYSIYPNPPRRRRTGSEPAVGADRPPVGEDRRGG